MGHEDGANSSRPKSHIAYRVFMVPVRDDGRATTELNGWLRTHRALSVERRWVEQASESFWSFCIDYLESRGGTTGGPAGSQWNEPGQGGLAGGAQPGGFRGLHRCDRRGMVAANGSEAESTLCCLSPLKGALATRTTAERPHFEVASQSPCYWRRTPCPAFQPFEGLLRLFLTA